MTQTKELADRKQRRKAALGSARSLLAEGGAATLSMRKLAAATGTAVNTLYAMFGTRDGVLEALVEDAIAQRVAVLRALDEPGTPVENLHAFVERSVQHAIEHERMIKPMYRAVAQLRKLRATANRVGLEMITSRLKSAGHSGDLRTDVDLAPLAELLVRTVNDSSLAWALDEIGKEELAARCHHALAVLLAAAASPGARESLQANLRQRSDELARARAVGSA